MAGKLLPMVTDDRSQSSGCGCSVGQATSEQAARLKSLDLEFGRIVRDLNSFERRAPERRQDTAVLGTARRLSLHAPLPLVREISHHHIEQAHLWIGVHEGAIMVLNDAAHAIFFLLTTADSVASVVTHVCEMSGCGQDAAWRAVSDVIGRAATAGFIAGVQGYTGHTAPKPDKFARLHITKACQLECVHCYAESDPYVDRSNELPPERWRRFIDDYAAQGGKEVLFTGGEALVYRGCLELMSFARAHNLFVTLFSNGILVPRHIATIKEAADKVQISLDGTDAKTNDAIRGQGEFARATKAIDTLLANGVSTTISMTVMHENWESWKRGFVAFAERYAGHVEFKVSYGVMQYGRGVNLDDIDVEETRLLVDEYVAQVNHELGPRVTRTKQGCGYGEQLVIGPDGIVYPCHLLDAPLCHLDDFPVPDIIIKLKEVAGAFDVDHVEGCSTCDIRYLCGGKCRVIEGRKIGTRLVTTCTPPEKEAKLRNVVRSYHVN